MIENAKIKNRIEAAKPFGSHFSKWKRLEYRIFYADNSLDQPSLFNEFRSRVEPHHCRPEKSTLN